MIHGDLFLSTEKVKTLWSCGDRLLTHWFDKAPPCVSCFNTNHRSADLHVYKWTPPLMWPAMDYSHLYLFVKGLRTPGLLINSQKCMGMIRSTSESNENSIWCLYFSHIVESQNKTTELFKALSITKVLIILHLILLFCVTDMLYTTVDNTHQQNQIISSQSSEEDQQQDKKHSTHHQIQQHMVHFWKHFTKDRIQNIEKRGNISEKTVLQIIYLFFCFLRRFFLFFL